MVLEGYEKALLPAIMTLANMNDSDDCNLVIYDKTSASERVVIDSEANQEDMRIVSTPQRLPHILSTGGRTFLIEPYSVL